MSTIKVPGYEALHEVATAPLRPGEYPTVMCSDLAHHYETGRDAGWWSEPALRTGAAELLRAMRGRTHQHVLDVGTARALDVPTFIGAGHRVTGIDLLPLRPECAVLEREYPGRARFLRTGLLELEPAAPFDAALDNGCFHHQHPESYPQYLGKLNELIRPGGLLTMLVFFAESRPGKLYTNSGGRLYRTFTEDELAALLAVAGFVSTASTVVDATTQHLRYLVMTSTKPEPVHP